MKIISKFLFLNLFLLFIHQAICSYLILPLKCKKRNNMDLPFNNKDIQKYLENDFTPDKFLKLWAMQIAYTEFKIGNPPINIKGEFFTNVTTTLLGVDERFQSETNINIFNYSVSNVSYIKLSSSSFDVSINGYSTDDFYFLFTEDLSSNNLTEEKVNMEFWLNTIRLGLDVFPGNDYTDIKKINSTFNFKLGIQTASYGYYIGNTNFINSLKDSKAIPSYDLTFEYYKNPKINSNSDYDEIGRVIFGKFEQIYNKEKYPPEELRVTNMYIDANNVAKYAFIASEMYLEIPQENNKLRNESISTKTQIEFFFDQGLIYGTKEYEDLIEKEFFNKYEVDKMCEKLSTMFSYRSRKCFFDTFICNKKIIEKYKDKFPILKIYQGDMKFVFEFNYNDLFREYQGKVYFLIAFPKLKEYDSNLWEFGKIFIRKYQLLFNVDGKVIRYYPPPPTKEEEEVVKETKKNSIWWTILKIIGFILIVIGAYFVGKKLNQKRKIRASELEDNFEYIQAPSSNENNLKDISQK